MRFRIPIWLTTLIVIFMILLFSLLIYTAREKEMVEQFNRQQMAIAKGIAYGIENLISGIEQNLKTLTSWRENDSHRYPLQFIFETLEGKADFVARSDGRSLNAYPPYGEKSLNPDLLSLAQDVWKARKAMVAFAPSSNSQTAKNLSGYVVIAAPESATDGHGANVVLAGISLANIAKAYIDTIKYDFSCDAWIVNDQGTILYPHLPGQDTAMLQSRESKRVTLKNILLQTGTGHDVFRRPVGSSYERLIVAFTPIRLKATKLFIVVSTPYKIATAQLKLTYYFIMLSAFFLIAAVVVASFAMVRSGEKRIRLEEELKHLRGKDALQEKLAREKSMVDGILEGSPIPTFVIDRQHRIILWNKACTDLTGYSSAEMIGTCNQYLPFYTETRPIIADLLINYDTDTFQRYYANTQLQSSTIIKGAYEGYGLFPNVGGKQRHLYFLAAPIRNEHGEIIAAIETLQDITREKEMSEALKDYTESLKNELDANISLREKIENLYTFLQSIIMSSPDRIYAMDSNGMVTYVSSGVGTPRSMYKEKSVHFVDLVDPENKALVQEKWEETKKGIFAPYEMEAKTRDGSKRNLLVTVTPIKGSDKFIVVHRDITEFKNLEKKFYESQHLAALGQLSAGIAHEVRNPLSSIKMSLQILERRMKPEGNDLKRFQIAQTEVEHLERLVNDILIYAKPEGLHRRELDFNAFIERSLEKAEKERTQKAIIVKMNLDPTMGLVCFDNAKLDQVLLNLYLNAIDAMEEGGRLEVATKRPDGPEGQTIELTIQDNGCGISEKDLAYIFNPFFTKKSYGTGLGLTQVKKIIDLHQGTIDVFSKEGEGTRVVITLPVS